MEGEYLAAGDSELSNLLGLIQDDRPFLDDLKRRCSGATLLSGSWSQPKLVRFYMAAPAGFPEDEIELGFIQEMSR